MINKNYLKIFHLLICLVVILFMALIHISADNIYSVVFYTTLIPTLSFMYCHKKIKGNLLSLSSIFLLTNYIFNFGQVILMAIFPKESKNLTIVFRYFTENELIAGLTVLAFSYIVLSMGLVVFINRSQIAIGNEHLHSYYSIGKIIFILTFPFKLIIDVYFLYTSLTKGFYVALDVLSSIPDFIVTFGNFAVLGVSLMIIALKNTPQKQNAILLASIMFIVLIMVSGRRSENVAYVIGLVYIYLLSRRKKIKFRTYLMIGVAALVFAGLLRSFVYLRNMDFKNNFSLAYAVDRVFVKDNIFLESLREFGNTGYTAVCVITKYLPIYGVSYGKSYYYGATAILPNIIGVAGQLTRESAFVEILQRTGSLCSQYQNIGGSFIGEAIFNFGVWGAQIFIFIIGMVISRISNLIEKSINNGNIKKLSFSILVLFATIYWTRDYFGGRIREIVWGYLFVLFIVKLLNVYCAKKEHISTPSVFRKAE